MSPDKDHKTNLWDIKPLTYFEAHLVFYVCYLGEHSSFIKSIVAGRETARRCERLKSRVKHAFVAIAKIGARTIYCFGTAHLEGLAVAVLV